MTKNRAFLVAKRKGREAAEAGKPRSPPYGDKRTYYNEGVTFSRAFIKYWLEGYDEALAEMDLPINDKRRIRLGLATSAK